MTRKLLKKETHGTFTCYNYGGCRCEECREANRKHNEKVRGKNREKYNKQMRELYARKKTKV